MTPIRNHPARSHAFLSRLHDGDLTAGERAHFEAHRAHCKECRDAAADFERALSLFRSSRSSPPPADLALRVLRKVQTQASSRRTPFGDLFSVDLRWAGAFAAALLVLLVAAPIVLQQQKKAASLETPIPVALESRELQSVDNKIVSAKPDAAAPSASSAPAFRQEQGRARAPQAAQAVPMRDEVKPVKGEFANAPPGDVKLEGKLATSNTDVAAAKPALAEKAQAREAVAQGVPAPAAAPVGETSRQAANLNRQVPAAPASQAAAPEAQGGEGARDQASISADSATLDRPARLVVQPLDALGRPPELDARFQAGGLNDLRGRSYVVLVDGQGRVTDAQETTSKKTATDPKRRDSALAKDKDKEKDNISQASALKNVRFVPGERQRRLLVRVE